MPLLARRFVPVLLALSVVGTGACSSSEDATSAGATKPGTVAATSDIHLRAGVPQIDGSAWDAVVLPHQGRDLWLKPEAKSMVSLDVGSVAVIKGRGVLKVGAVRQDGDHLVVEQGELAFADFIENGKIVIDGRVPFDAAFVDSDSDVYVDVAPSSASPSGMPAPKGAPVSPASLRPLGDDPNPAPITSPPTSAGKSLIDGAKDFVLDGWHVQKTSISTGDDSLRYETVLTKESGAFDAKIRLSGNVVGLATRFQVAVHDHVNATHTFDVKTSGAADLEWAVRINKSGTGYNKILAPGLSYKQQFFVGEVPMVLKVKSAIGVILGGSGASTTTTGKVHLSYSSDGGVAITSESGDGQSMASGDLGFDGQQGTLATAPAAFGFVATLPKVDLGVGLDGLFVTGATFSNSITSLVTAQGAVAGSKCADIETTLKGKVGLFIDVTDSPAGQVISTGAALANGLLSHTVYEKQRHDRTCGLNP